MILKFLALQYLTVITIVVQIAVFLISGWLSLFPGAEAMQSIAGSFAEIIAGLYGLTLASYTFFLSRIDGLVASDPTLDYVTAGMKRRFKYLIWHITRQVFLCLAVSALLMYIPEPISERVPFFYRLCCNEFIVFFAMSVVLILYYSVSVVAPNAVPKEAAKRRKKLETGDTAPGSVTEFLKLYRRITTVCDSFLPADVLDQIHESKGKRFEYTIPLLLEARPELENLRPELERIHHYYECMLNCEKLAVSNAMIELTRKMLAELDK